MTLMIAEIADGQVEAAGDLLYQFFSEEGFRDDRELHHAVCFPRSRRLASSTHLVEGGFTLVEAMG